MAALRLAAKEGIFDMAKMTKAQIKKLIAKTPDPKKREEVDSAMGKKLGAKIREMREGLGMLDYELGAIMGIHRQTEYRREVGSHDLRVVDLIRYAEVFGVKPSEMIDGITTKG